MQAAKATHTPRSDMGEDAAAALPPAGVLPVDGGVRLATSRPLTPSLRVSRPQESRGITRDAECAGVAPIVDGAGISGLPLRQVPTGGLFSPTIPVPALHCDEAAETVKIVAHDINNLLAVIDGSLKQMQRRADPVAREALIERMGRAVARGAVLSRRLLDVGRPAGNAPAGSTVRRQLVDLAADLDQALEGTAVVAEIDPDLWAFRADPEELYLALLNLCRNAGDAMPSGGAVLVSARNLAAAPGTSHGSVEVSVADGGTGMREVVLSRAFEPYFTTKEPGKGSGLGLAQVREFVERQGGTIGIESKPGIGTLVRMLLPRSVARAEGVWDGEQSDDDAPIG